MSVRVLLPNKGSRTDVQPTRAPIPDKVVAQLLYEADHTCCICRNKKFDVQVHHISGRMDSRPANLIVLCLNCHSEVERKGGLGRVYSPSELQRYKESWVREIAMRRKHAKALDQSLVLFEVKRLTYRFQALDFQDERRALEIMRQVLLFGRFSSHEVKEDCVSFVYETASWLMRGFGSEKFVSEQSGEFVSHQTSILMECSPIITLVAPSRKPLTKRDIDLLKHVINVAGEIAYSVCKYMQNEETAQHAIFALHDLLRFAVLNDLSECEDAVLQEFVQCERISREQHFEPALKHLDLLKKDALTYRQKQRKRNTKAVT